MYEQCLLLPFQRLVRALAPAMLGLDASLEVLPALDKTISRIYRDTRFSLDKSRYNDRMWLLFRRMTAKKADSPAFFFEIECTSYSYGMGFFRASVQTMNAYRELILKNEALFSEIIADLQVDALFTPGGELYKKNRYPGNTSALAGWYNKKNIYLINEREDMRELYDFDALVERLHDGFLRLAPLYHFLLEAVMLRNRNCSG